MVNRPAKNRRTYDTSRRALQREAKAHQWPCELCGQPINYDAPTYAPDSFTADHKTPWSKTQDDSLTNLQPAHRWCNTSKGAGNTARTPYRGENRQSRDW